MPSKSVPSRPSLEFDRKAAKRLLDEVQSSDSGALNRVSEHHPRYTDPTGIEVSTFQLSHAQLVIVREYGFSSWRQWKQFVEDRNLDLAERAAAMLVALCSEEFRRGAELLASEPELAGHDFTTACACGDLPTVQREIERDASVAVTAGGPNGWQPIVYACWSRFLRRDAERASAIVEIVRLLLANGADPNGHYLIEHGDGQLPQTCVYAAAGIANNADLTRMLLEAGADASERVGEGLAANEAIYHGAEFNDTTCLRLLLERDTDPREVTYCLSRALDFDNDEAALLFLEHGADASHAIAHHDQRTHLHKAVVNRRSARVIRALLEGGADPNRTDGAGMSPYRFAVSGYPEIVPLQEEFGADPSQATDEDRARGAFEAAAPEQLMLAARRGDLERVERLLDAGTGVDTPEAFPALHGACYAGQLEAARLLLDRGASLTTTNTHGGDPLGVVIYGSTDCADPEGGPGMILPEEFDGQWPEIAELLLGRGVTKPERFGGGSDGVKEVLRRHGVPEGE